jgi:hypothetical protein
VIMRDTETGGSQERREWRVGVGVVGVRGMIRLWRYSAFLWGIKVARVPGGLRVRGEFSAQWFNESTKHFHCREANTLFCPTPLVI